MLFALLGCIVGVWLSLRQMLPEVLQTALLRQQLFPWLLLEMAGFLLCSGFAGFSAVGQPVACAALFLHGMWFGWSILQQMTTHAVRVLLWLMPYGIERRFCCCWQQGKRCGSRTCSSAMRFIGSGRKYAALSAAVSGAVCSDTGIIWRIVIALSGAAKLQALWT